MNTAKFIAILDAVLFDPPAFFQNSKLTRLFRDSDSRAEYGVRGSPYSVFGGHLRPIKDPDSRGSSLALA